MQTGIYTNGWGGGAKTPEALGEAAQAVVARGFTALKFDPFPGPWGEILSLEAERRAVATVAAVREAVGPDVEILVEVHRRLAPVYAIRVARAMEPYRPFWYEEPVSVRNLSALAAAKREIALPVVTKAEFRPIFEAGAADIINPDICNCGGILELKEIAAAIPNFLITEYFVNFEELGREIARPPLVAAGGYVALPTAPGLGIDLDEDALARHAYAHFPACALRARADEGP